MRATVVSAAILGCLVLSPVPAAQGASERPNVGMVEKVQARAEAVHEASARPLAASSPLLFDDLLRTGAGARLQATLADGTALTLGENGSMLVDEFVYAPGATDGELLLKVVKGSFLFVGGQVESGGRGRVEIATPLATLGIRGTQVWGGFIDGGYGVLVLDGEVTVTTQGGSTTLRAGEAVMIDDPALRPSVPTSWTEERTARAVQSISFD